MNLKYFKISEFDSPDLKGSGRNMDPNFLKKLDKARAYSGVPFKITSGYRTIEYNSKLKNSTVTSSHIKGLAADIAIKSSRDRFLILEALIKEGFCRIGIAENFIHVDDDYDKALKIIWYYG